MTHITHPIVIVILDLIITYGKLPMEMQYIYRCRDAMSTFTFFIGTFTSGTKRIFKIMQLDLTHGLESIFIPVDRVLPSNLAIYNRVKREHN